MEGLLLELSENKCWKSYLKTQCRRNKVDPALSNAFTIVKARLFYQKMAEGEGEARVGSKSSVWKENELKLFQWTSVVLSGSKARPIESFIEEDWTQLGEIFSKDTAVVEYEGLKLIREKNPIKRKWCHQEDTILEGVIRGSADNNRWNEVARSLFELSDKKFFRSGKQCREQWLNHLDPSKKRGEWEPKEDEFIVSYILKHGNKWADISKQLESKRTEHMVKNRFKSIVITLKKKFPCIRDEGELLRRFLTKKPQDQPEIVLAAAPASLIKQELNIEGLPVVNESAEEMDEAGMAVEDEQSDRISNQGSIEMHQVVTPCPVICQTFTPNFLNTPHAMPFLVNYSFDLFEQKQNTDNQFLRYD